MAIYYMMEPYWKKRGLGPLNDCTWAEIQQAAQEGKAADYWSVGDRKEVILNGAVGQYKTFSNYSCYVYILGFDHNAQVEGYNTIHFQFGFDALTGGNHICFIDSRYQNVWAADNSKYFKMYNSQRDTKGWKDSVMRNIIIPEFISAMPSDLQAVLKTVNKYTDNGTGTTHQSSSDVTATSDKVFLLAEYEIWGTRKYANQYEKNSQAQYDYYKDGNSTLVYKDTDTTTAAYAWVRSPFYNANTRFLEISYSGNVAADYSEESLGIAPAFVVG